MQPFAYLYIACMLATLGYAIVAGQSAERAAALVNVAASVASWLIVPSFRSAFGEPEWSVWLIDAMASCCFFAIAVRSRSFWPVWAFGFSTAAVAATIARSLSGEVPSFIYFESESAWPYATMLVISIGTAARSRPWMILRV